VSRAILGTIGVLISCCKLKKALLLPSLPTESWQVNASDPHALTLLLDLPLFVVTGMAYDAPLDYLVVFCAHAAPLAVCPTCGHLSQEPHQYTHRRVRDLPLAGKLCSLEFTGRRCTCATCGVPFTEVVEPIAPRGRSTRRFEQSIFEQCRATSIQAVHRRERLGYKAVEGIYYRLAVQQETASAGTVVRRLGIDEIALKKGHDQYVLVVSDLERGRVLTVLPTRTKEMLETYLMRWRVEARAAVTDIALDLWLPYHLAVSACLPKARITADRFHVMKSLTEQVTAARREIQRAAPEADKQVLKGCRWLVVKNKDELSEEEQDKLEGMFVVSPALKQLHELKEAFRTIFETAPDRQTAEEELRSWVGKVEQSGAKRLSKFVNTLRTWWEVILNYFHEHVSSGVVEGLNTKVKLVKRTGFGFRNFAHFRLRLLIECGGMS
jgi:transposase